MAGRGLKPQRLADMDMSSIRYQDVRPSHDLTARSLIGRAYYNSETGEYDADVRYDLRDPANHFCRMQNPKLTKKGTLFNAFADLDGKPIPGMESESFLTHFSVKDGRKLSEAASTYVINLPNGGQWFDFSVVADLMPESKHDKMNPNLTIDFSKPLRQSDYRCLKDMYDEQKDKAEEIVREDSSMAMENTDKFRAIEDASKPKPPVHVPTKNVAPQPAPPKSVSPQPQSKIDEMLKQADANLSKVNELHDRAANYGASVGEPMVEGRLEAAKRQTGINKSRLQVLNLQAQRLAERVDKANDGQDGPSFEG